MGSRCGSPSLIRIFLRLPESGSGSSNRLTGQMRSISLLNIGFSALSGLFAAIVNPYHLGAAFIAKPRTIKKSILL
jgi:hypothetical protein